MNIHEERKLKPVKDRMLWSKMMEFAAPYRKSIALSFLFALMISAAAVTQPLIVKSAIDDRMNGALKPMAYAVNPEAAASLAADPRAYGKPVEWNGRIYYRVKAGDGAWPEGVIPAHIAVKDDAYRLYDASAMSGTVLTDEDMRQFRKQDISGFIGIAALFLLNVAVMGLFTYWQSNLLQNTGQRIIYDMRNRMFERLSRLQTSFYDRNPVGRLVTRVAHDVEAVNQLYSQVIVNLAKELLLLVGIASIMIWLNWQMALVSFAVIPLLLIATAYFKSVIREAQRLARVMLSRLNSFLAESLSGMTVVQMFTREKKQLDEFVELNDAHYRAGMKGTVNNSIFNPLIGFFGNAALALVVWYGGRSVLDAGITFGIVYAYTSYVRQFFQPLTALSDRYTQIQTALASAERIVELLEERPTITNAANAKPLLKPLRGEVELDRVWFAYEAEDWVLRDISLRIRPGETVAFVGATGAGKSSIIGLLNRFYDVQKGSVRLDGEDLRGLDLQELRSSIGVIQQDPFVFSGNIYDNIRMNRASITDEDIRRAARELEMEDFIERLPQSYETAVGEQGLKLSSGQQQLLAFLRVYVGNPEILILDEATSHVDTETELTLQRGLMRLSRGRTTIIVAHRLSTIRHADNIVVMEKGRIKEMGSHDALMNRGGAYRRLYDLQNNAAAADLEKTAAR